MLFPSSFKTVIGAQQGVQIQQEKMLSSPTLTEREMKKKISERCWLRVRSVLQPTTRNHSAPVANKQPQCWEDLSCQTASNWTQTENLLSPRGDVTPSRGGLFFQWTNSPCFLLTSACRCDLVFVCKVTATSINDRQFTVTWQTSFTRSQQHRWHFFWMCEGWA